MRPAILPWRCSDPVECWAARRPHAAASRDVSSGRGSTTNAETLDQRLVAIFVPRLQIVEERAAQRDELQKATTRMIVLHMRLEVAGEIGDALGEDRHLHLRRARVTGLGAVFLDERVLALGRD